MASNSYKQAKKAHIEAIGKPSEIKLLEVALEQEIGSKLPIPTGAPDGTKYLRDDNTWQPVDGGGGGLTQQQIEGLI